MDSADNINVPDEKNHTEIGGTKGDAHTDLKKAHTLPGVDFAHAFAGRRRLHGRGDITGLYQRGKCSAAPACRFSADSGGPDDIRVYGHSFISGLQARYAMPLYGSAAYRGMYCEACGHGYSSALDAVNMK